MMFAKLMWVHLDRGDDLYTLEPFRVESAAHELQVQMRHSEPLARKALLEVALSLCAQTIPEDDAANGGRAFAMVDFVKSMCVQENRSGVRSLVSESTVASIIAQLKRIMRALATLQESHKPAWCDSSQMMHMINSISTEFEFGNFTVF